MSARARLEELFAKVDAFFERAAAAMPGADGITCHRGCDDCCRRRFSVTGIEADAVLEALAQLDDARRAEIAGRVREGNACPMLDADGGCAVYAARPLICRTHGLAIRFTEPGSERRLPVLDACPKNFGGRALTELPASTVLDQTTLSTILGALDAAHAAELGRPRGDRVEIIALAEAREPRPRDC